MHGLMKINGEYVKKNKKKKNVSKEIIRSEQEEVEVGTGKTPEMLGFTIYGSVIGFSV